MDASTRKAVNDSIKHHKENLRLLRTLKGKFRNNDFACYFEIGNELIWYDGSNCPLCKKFSGVKCYMKCPLGIYQDDRCGSSTIWAYLSKARTKSQAIAAEKKMIKVLEEL